jgi:predicted nucleic acid-binding protein
MPSKKIMIDSNVLLDILMEDKQWFTWSSGQLQRLSESHIFVINPIIYSEVSIGFKRIEDLEDALPSFFFRREPIPWEAAFLAGKCFVEYRRRGGNKQAPLPDFFIGAHAVILDMSLLTRDTGRYRTYFPNLELITPD